MPLKTGRMRRKDDGSAKCEPLVMRWRIASFSSPVNGSPTTSSRNAVAVGLSPPSSPVSVVAIFSQLFNDETYVSDSQDFATESIREATTQGSMSVARFEKNNYGYARSVAKEKLEKSIGSLAHCSQLHQCCDYRSINRFGLLVSDHKPKNKIGCKTQSYKIMLLSAQLGLNIIDEIQGWKNLGFLQLKCRFYCLACQHS